MVARQVLSGQAVQAAHSSLGAGSFCCFGGALATAWFEFGHAWSSWSGLCLLSRSHHQTPSAAALPHAAEGGGALCTQPAGGARRPAGAGAADPGHMGPQGGLWCTARGCALLATAGCPTGSAVACKAGMCFGSSCSDVVQLSPPPPALSSYTLCCALPTRNLSGYRAGERPSPWSSACATWACCPSACRPESWRMSGRASRGGDCGSATSLRVRRQA